MTIRPCPACGSKDARMKFEEEPFLVVRCASCSLVYVANPPDEEDLYDDYYSGDDLRAEEYAAHGDDPRLRELYAINEQRVRRLKKLKSGGRLLDVGCGRGFFLQSANEHGYESKGIDVSEKAVAYARSEFGVTADTRGLKEIATSNERFDVITLWHVLEHFTEPYDALANVRELLTDDGLCVVEVPNLHSLKFILSKTKWEGGNHPRYHRTFFTHRTLRRALANSGFSDVRRMRWSYDIPGRSARYEQVKTVLDWLALDAFLDFAAWP